MKALSVKQSLLDRRSIRRYEREAIPAEDMEFIYEAIRNTPTAFNGQQYVVIDIDDQDTKEKLYELTDQKQIKTCSHFLVFAVDYHRITLAAEQAGLKPTDFSETLDGYTTGVIDASLAMMGAQVAAQSLGLGACCVGYVRTANPAKIAELLQLPEQVTIVCGLALGIPRELPDLKPKQPASLLIHHNHYRQDDMLQQMHEYNELVTQYNATRAGGTSDNDWLSHILGYYDEASHLDMLRAVREQGFLSENH